MKYYFAYGSNLHHAQMKRRCPKCKYIKKYILQDYQLTFRSKYGACDIEKKLGKKVYGALYIISKCAEKDWMFMKSILRYIRRSISDIKVTKL